jgi:hypothetical protein
MERELKSEVEPISLQAYIPPPRPSTASVWKPSSAISQPPHPTFACTPQILMVLRPLNNEPRCPSTQLATEPAPVML